MLLKAQILERFVSGFNRFFKVNLFSRQTVQSVQFHSGGDDYNPPAGCEGLNATIGDNPANSVIFGWRDATLRKAAPGEKRIYAVAQDGNVVVGELHLKNDGTIELTNSGALKIVVTGNADISAASVNIAAGVINLGEGGQPIARLGDEVQVDPGAHKGTITSAGTNTSI